MTRKELQENDDNLNIRRYADNAPPPEPHDVRAGRSHSRLSLDSSPTVASAAALDGAGRDATERGGSPPAREAGCHRVVPRRGVVRWAVRGPRSNSESVCAAQESHSPRPRGPEHGALHTAQDHVHGRWLRVCADLCIAARGGGRPLVEQAAGVFPVLDHSDRGLGHGKARQWPFLGPALLADDDADGPEVRVGLYEEQGGGVRADLAPVRDRAR